MSSNHKVGVAGLALFAAAGALFSPAKAVNEKKLVHPTILFTVYAGSAKLPDDCSLPNLPACVPVAQQTNLAGLNVPPGTVLVGFQRLPAPGDTCPCNILVSGDFRGSVAFRTRDIPHHFVSATLVLQSQDAGQQVGLTFNDNLVAALFEVPPSTPPEFAADDFDLGTAISLADLQNLGKFPGLAFTIEQPSGRTTVIQELGALAPVAQDTTLQDQVFLTGQNPKVQRTGPNYRLDVTDRVQKWVADWPNRLKTPSHGFTFVGLNEINPIGSFVSNVALWAHYDVTLEFDIDAPDF
jgi:hypothetical protein